MLSGGITLVRFHDIIPHGCCILPEKKSIYTHIHINLCVCCPGACLCEARIKAFWFKLLMRVPCLVVFGAMNVLFGVSSSPYQPLTNPTAEQMWDSWTATDLTETDPFIVIKWTKLMKRLVLVSKGFVKYYRDRCGRKTKSYRWVHDILLMKAALRDQLPARRVYVADGV